MAYQVPKQWSHGDTPTAADMNKYSDALNAIHALAGDATSDAAVHVVYSMVPAYVDWGRVYTSFWFTHQLRWLAFRGSGVIRNQAGTQSTAISSTGGGWSTYDLNTISWLAYGSMYEVADGVEVAIEVIFG